MPHASPTDLNFIDIMSVSEDSKHEDSTVYPVNQESDNCLSDFGYSRRNSCGYESSREVFYDENDSLATNDSEKSRPRSLSVDTISVDSDPILSIHEFLSESPSKIVHQYISDKYCKTTDDINGSVIITLKQRRSSMPNIAIPVTAVIPSLLPVQTTRPVIVCVPSPHPARYLTVRVNDFRTIERGGQKFVQFGLHVVGGKLEWSVFRRYSEFVRLRKDLRKYISKKHNPKDVISLSRRLSLPSKTVLRRFSNSFCVARQLELDSFMQRILSVPDLATTPPVLCFLGAGVGPFDYRSIWNHNWKSFDRMNLDVFAEIAQSGDIVFFRTPGIVQSAFRKATACKWDHVGIIVRVAGAGRRRDSVQILDATSEGIRLYPLILRVRAWHRNHSVVACRRLFCERTARGVHDLNERVNDAIGSRFGISPLRVLKRRAPSTNDQYFCSELVAYCLQSLGVLAKDSLAHRYLPSSFASGGNIKLINATLSDEIYLDVARPEIHQAVHSPTVVQAPF
eukprot:204819_1